LIGDDAGGFSQFRADNPEVADCNLKLQNRTHSGGTHGVDCDKKIRRALDGHKNNPEKNMKRNKATTTKERICRTKQSYDDEVERMKR
jgi:hypothetical protein